MTDVGAFMKAVERIEEKLDDIRDTLHEIDLMASGTQIKQLAQETEIKELKKEVADLKSAYDKASGAWKLLSIPGIASALYTIFNMVGK